jgi:propanol-preferring alcohol dehydrogenase
VLTRLRLPDAVSDEEAGPIMCGGVTAYTACKRSAVKPGQWLVVTGAGGGLGHLGLQYAKAMGMRVIAIDGGDEKAKLCKDLGAEEYLDFTSVKDMAAEITRITKYGAHAVIVFAASKESYAAAPNFLRPGGTVVAVGLTADPSVVAGAPPIQLALKRLNIVGSVTGTLKDVEEAYVSLRILLMMLEAVIHTDSMSRLDFTARGLVHPILTKGTLDDVDKFCEMLKHGKLPGRAVLKVSS